MNWKPVEQQKDRGDMLTSWHAGYKSGTSILDKLKMSNGWLA